MDNQRTALRRSTAWEWLSLKYFSKAFLIVDFMRSNRSFLSLTRRYFRQFIRHSQSGYFYSNTRYCFISYISL